MWRSAHYISRPGKVQELRTPSRGVTTPSAIYYKSGVRPVRDICGIEILVPSDCRWKGTELPSLCPFLFGKRVDKPRKSFLLVTT
jgi:hypothetical protein